MSFKLDLIVSDYLVEGISGEAQTLDPILQNWLPFPPQFRARYVRRWEGHLRLCAMHLFSDSGTKQQGFQAIEMKKGLLQKN